MMTRSHIRALLHATLFALLLSLGSLNVRAQLKPTFTVGLHGSCTPRQMTVTNTTKGASSRAKYIWDFGNGVKDTTTEIYVNTIYNNPGGYTVTLTMYDGDFAASSSESFVLPPNPISNFSSSVIKGCLPFIDSLKGAFQSDGTATEYFWDFGDGLTERTDGPDVAHLYTTHGSSFVQLTVINSAGCASTSKKNNLIQFIPSCDLNVSPPPDTVTNRNPKAVVARFGYTSKYIVDSICPPEVFYFLSKTVGAIGLAWDFGDGSKTVNNPSPSHTYYSRGKYYVTLTALRTDSSVSTLRDSVIVQSPFATVQVDVPQNCLGSQVTLRARMQNVVTSSWDFGDGTVMKQPDSVVTHQYKTAGIYKPVLSVWDTLGCYNVYQPTVPVVIDTLHAFLKPSLPLVCDSALVRFASGASSLSSTQLSEALSYHWNFGTGRPGDTASIAAPTFYYKVPGKYPVSLTVGSLPGCGYVQTDTIVVAQSSHGLITGPSEVCTDAPANFTATPTLDGPVTWHWIFPGGQTDSSRNSTLVATTGSYTIKLVTGLNGCFDTSFAGLIVHPQPNIALTPKDPVVCLGNSVTLAAHDGVTYQWGPAPGLNNYTLNDPDATPKVSTTYKVQAVNQYGCTNSDSTFVFVAPPITVQLPKDTFVCQGSSIVLSPTGAYAYQWIAGIDPQDSTQSVQKISPVVNTPYSVVGYDQYHCFTDTAVVNVTIEPLPTLKAVPVGSLVAGNSVTLQTDASPDVISWEWSPGDYLSCTDCSAPVSSPKTSIQYTVTGKTEYGCSASDTVSIKLVCMDDGVRIPNAFTPNNDGMNDVFYPMGKGVRVISSWRIYGRWGNLVFERHDIQLDDPSNGWNGQVGGVDQPTGSYIYEMVLICDTGDVFTKKGTVLLER